MNYLTRKSLEYDNAVLTLYQYEAKYKPREMLQEFSYTKKLKNQKSKID